MVSRYGSAVIFHEKWWDVRNFRRMTSLIARSRYNIFIFLCRGERMLKFRLGPSEEFPRAIYWTLFVGLWALLIATGTILYLRYPLLSAWKIGLYGALLIGYLLAEKWAHTRSQAIGSRTHEGLRYLISLGWWLLILGALLVYGLFPLNQLLVTAAGVVLTVAGMALRVWSVQVLGAFFSGHIEAQKDQSVVENGPYRRIRHPGYLGSMLQALGMPLVLNAYLILPVCVVFIFLLMRRLRLEEAYLTHMLPGYAAYSRRTSRLIPGIW